MQHSRGRFKLSTGELKVDNEKDGVDSSCLGVVLLMEEILHHLGCIKPCKWWDDKLLTSTD